jgi:hypothetical protein
VRQRRQRTGVVEADEDRGGLLGEQLVELVELHGRVVLAASTTLL